MKKTLTLIAAFVLLAAGAVAQKLSYSAVVRDSDNKLVANQNITVAIAIANSENDNPVYGETHSATTNQNGLVTLTIGEGTGKTGSLSAVTWPTAHITSTFSLPGGAQVVSTAPANAVPYALYADNVGNVDYSNISNTPDIPAAANDATLTIQKNGNTVGTFTANASTNATVNVTVPTRTSELENNSGYITQTDLNNLASQYQHLLDSLGGVVSAQQTAIAAQQATLTAQQAIIDSLCNAGSGSAATPLDNTTTAWTDGNTFAVPAGGLTYSDAITVSGDVTLVLTAGETLTLNKGISLAEGATLTVEGTGTMNVNGTNGADNNSNDVEASGGSGTAAISGSGTLVLTSGTVTAIGGNGGNVSDYGPECKGGHGAAAISCTLTVNGGTLTATGGNGGSLTNGFGPEGVAGNGGAGVSGALTVNGGTLTATGGNGGAKSSGPGTQAGSNGRGVSSTWTAGTGITFSDSANGTSWTANTGTSSTQRYVKAE